MDRDEIKLQIEQRILEGLLLPGEKLNERELAAEFGVSRTPIRNVLTRLEAEGLVEHFARRGVYVRRSSLSYVLSLLELLRFWRFCPAYCPLPGRRHLPVPVLRKAPGPGLLWQVYVIAYPTPLSSALRTHGYPL